MAFLFKIRRGGIAAGLSLLAWSAWSAPGNYASEGGEYKPIGTLMGDQTYAGLSIKPSGGYLVWQDNITDGDGTGISARKLDGSLTGTFSPFRVNQIGADDQEKPQVTLLSNGGAAFVWQGGKQGMQHIYGRILGADGLWATDDFLVNTATNVTQRDAAAITLTNGNVVVAWASAGQVSSTSMQDVYFQILLPGGTKYGGEVLANQYTAYNQRSARLAALSDGRFVAVWISESRRFENSVDVYGRVFSASGTAASAEFLINAGTNVCANPAVAAVADGGFAVTWSEMDLEGVDNRWDIFARAFSANLMGGTTRRVNTYTVGDQVDPKISALNSDYLVAWTSVGQDGSREGIYAQFLQADGSPQGSEFGVNTTTISQQVMPVIASDGAARFMTVWSGYAGGGASMDLYAQRYVNTDQPLNAPGAPIVSVLDTTRLALTWPHVDGISVASYEVYIDGASTAAVETTNNFWTATALSAGSTHTFRLAYVLPDGRSSPLSPVATGTTYLFPFAWQSIPYDWMYANFGSDVNTWPRVDLDSDGDGVSNLLEFLQGTDPTDSASVLKYQLRLTEQGVFLDWNTQPGLLYQVQFTPVLNGTWTDLGGARFAASTNDSLFVGQSSGGFYRIGRVR
ncbi:MAG: fibronectin type III domain-containing protein [Verrucomicrobiae bacterium]|nr:fibronectin type III domain-containing protein [Verrucomicrobiae bacterium]